MDPVLQHDVPQAVHAAHAERLFALIPQRRVLQRPVPRIDDGFGVAQKPIAGGRELDVVAIPGEELDTKGFLKKPDPRAYCALRQKQIVGGPPKVAGAVHFQKRLQEYDIHARSTNSRCRFDYFIWLYRVQAR